MCVFFLSFLFFCFVVFCFVFSFYLTNIINLFVKKKERKENKQTNERNETKQNKTPSWIFNSKHIILLFNCEMRPTRCYVWSGPGFLLRPKSLGRINLYKSFLFVCYSIDHNVRSRESHLTNQLCGKTANDILDAAFSSLFLLEL